MTKKTNALLDTLALLGIIGTLASFGLLQTDKPNLHKLGAMGIPVSLLVTAGAVLANENDKKDDDPRMRDLDNELDKEPDTRETEFEGQTRLYHLKNNRPFKPLDPHSDIRRY